MRKTAGIDRHLILQPTFPAASQSPPKNDASHHVCYHHGNGLSHTILWWNMGHFLWLGCCWTMAALLPHRISSGSQTGKFPIWLYLVYSGLMIFPFQCPFVGDFPASHAWWHCRDLQGINFGSLVWSCDFESSSSVLLLVRSANFASSMATFYCVYEYALCAVIMISKQRNDIDNEKYSGNNSYVPNKLVSANLSLCLSLSYLNLASWNYRDLFILPFPFWVPKLSISLHVKC